MAHMVIASWTKDNKGNIVSIPLIPDDGSEDDYGEQSRKNTTTVATKCKAELDALKAVGKK